MRKRYLHTLSAVALVFPLLLGAQARRDGRSAATPSEEVVAGSNVTVVPLNLSRQAVQNVSQQLSANGSGKSSRGGGIAGALRKTVQGDKSEIDAAKRVLGQMAQSHAADGRTTVIVVIGSEEDRDKVIASLAGVERKVTLAFVDRSFEDAAVDNTVLNAGLQGNVTDGATNMWVYLPRRGSSVRDKPDKTLSTRVASPTLWNGLFTADGDALNVDQVKSLVSSRDSSNAEGDASGGASSAGGPMPGDVVVPKIANVKILADAATDSKVLGTVAKTDELVVTGAAKNGFIRVEGAAASGWVSINLVTKK